MNKNLLVSLLVIFTTIVFLASCKSSSVSSPSPESIVKAYVNGLAEGNLELFFSYNFHYRIREAEVRNSAPKERWKELTEQTRLQYEDFLKKGSIGTIESENIYFRLGCAIFNDYYGKTEDEKEYLLDYSECFYACDFLYEPYTSLKATVEEVRVGKLINLDLEYGPHLGVYKDIPTWEAFIRVEYLQQDTAPELAGDKVKEVRLKMNVVKIVPKNEHVRMRVELLGFGSFSVDGLTEIIEKVSWHVPIPMDEPKEKQRNTMKDITVISTAIVDYVSDNGITPKQEGIYDTNSEFHKSLSPFYIKFLPIKDAWGNNYRIYCGTACNGVYGISGAGSDDFIVVSYGADGKEGAWKFDSSNRKAGLIEIKTANDFNIDLVMWNGVWIRAPRTVAVW